MKISSEEARRIILGSQGLLGKPSWVAKTGVRQALEHLGYVQIDTLAVVARAHHHTLWSRTEGYQEDFLDHWVKQKEVFEYWSHAASYLPMKDYRFSLTCKQVYAKGKSHWFGQDPRMKAFVLERITAEGPLQSKDFEYRRQSPGHWYEWKPAKKALEQLFMEGKLMVAERRGFQKLYDLTERVLPPGIDTTPPSEDESTRHLILKAIAAHGIATASEIGYLRSYARKAIAKNIVQLVEENIIIPVKVDKIDTTYYGMKDFNPLQLSNDEVHLLSPFDNAMIQRKRLRALFNFDYTLECYLPEQKRKFGYFCLPVLQGDRFVARFDPKADRTKRTFYIRHFHREKGWSPTQDFAMAFIEKLKAFASFNGCEKIEACNDVPAIIRKMV